MPAEKSKKTVLVTGFGPFQGHLVNASWEAVKRLPTLSWPDDIELVTKEIPVEYHSVKAEIPKLWETHKPHLVVHVGVSSLAEGITLEQQAHNHGYQRDDILGCRPENYCCVPGAHECIVSQLDMGRVCQDINNSTCEIKAIVSHDPGRYLCDFSYFTSLHIDNKRAAFIHVPPLDKPYSAELLALGLQEAISAMLTQLVEGRKLMTQKLVYKVRKNIMIQSGNGIQHEFKEKSFTDACLVFLFVRLLNYFSI